MSVDYLADTALQALAAGSTDRAEALLVEALEAARKEGRSDLEIRVGVALAELWVSLGERDEATRLFEHLHGLIGRVADTKELGVERRRVRRYLDELQPLDPKFVEWGD